MLNVVPFESKHRNLANHFKSGNAHLDAFLKSDVALDIGYGKTYIALRDDKEAIIGYYNISTSCIEQVNASGRSLRIGGSAFINCFALDAAYHGTVQEVLPSGRNINLSDLLLVDCVSRIREVRDKIGFSFINLCSTREGYNMYLRNNFEPLDEDLRFSIEEDMAFEVSENSEHFCAPLYLPLDWE